MARPKTPNPFASRVAVYLREDELELLDRQIAALAAAQGVTTSRSEAVRAAWILSSGWLLFSGKTPYDATPETLAAANAISAQLANLQGKP